MSDKGRQRHLRGFIGGCNAYVKLKLVSSRRSFSSNEGVNIRINQFQGFSIERFQIIVFKRVDIS